MIKSVESKSRWADIEAEINESIQSRFWDGVLKEINYFESTVNGTNRCKLVFCLNYARSIL